MSDEQMPERIHTGWVDDGEEYDPEMGHPWDLFLDGNLPFEDLPPEYQERAYAAGLAQRPDGPAVTEQRPPDALITIPDLSQASDADIDAFAQSLWSVASETLRERTAPEEPAP